MAVQPRSALLACSRISMVAHMLHLLKQDQPHVHNELKRDKCASILCRTPN